MKKFLVFFTTAILLCACLLGGCSCNEASLLTFTDGWSKNESIGYKETAVYSITLDKTFSQDSYDFTKELKDDLIKYDYDGTLTVTNEIGDRNLLPENLRSLDILESVEKIIYRKEVANLSFTYRLGNMTEDKTETDVIETETYFSDSETSLRPIYSTSSITSSYIDYTNTIKVQRKNIESNITYYPSKYVYNATEKDLTDTAKSPRTVEKTYSYTQRTLIDNGQLLFALRNFNLSSGSVSVLPVNSISYQGDKKDLQIKNFANLTKEIQLEVNGSTQTAKIPLKCYAYKVNDTYSGASQLTYIQRDISSEEATANEGAYGTYKSMLVQYIKPLYTTSTIVCQGALVHTLTSISWN